MDFTSTSGSGGRQWKAFAITFTTTDTDVVNKKKMNDLLATYTKFRPYITIPHEHFQVDNKYTFSIYMCTFLLGNYFHQNIEFIIISPFTSL